jgi:NitT/TauT family transport system substrate-binding protein
MGYFEEVGLKVELTNGQGADKVMTALLTNEADIGLMGCEQSIYVYLQGKLDYPKIVGQLTKRDGSFLVARNPIANFDYKDIDGKKVLMGRTGGMPAMILQYILNNKGYYNEVNIDMDYGFDFGNLGTTFAGGVGDFVPLFEPNASQLVKEGKGYIVSGIGLDSGEVPYTCYAVSQSYLAKNTAKVEKFLEAVWKGYEYLMNNNVTVVANVLKPFFDTDIAVIESAIKNYKDYDVWNATPVTSRAAFERMQDIMTNAGQITKRADYDKVVDNTIANKVK